MVIYRSNGQSMVSPVDLYRIKNNVTLREIAQRYDIDVLTLRRERRDRYSRGYRKEILDHIEETYQHTQLDWNVDKLQQLLNWVKIVGNKRKLARLLKVDPATISHWTSGRQAVPAAALIFLRWTCYGNIF